MTGGPRILPDRNDRVQAATCFTSNIVVEAGAGTGKTSLLVERVLVALGSGQATIEAITAITFTEKAAAEMRTRLTAGLEELHLLLQGGWEPEDRGSEAVRAHEHLAGQDDPAAAAGRILEALQRIDRAQVVTIHTFCSNLLRAWPREAGVDPGFDIDQGELGDRIREDSWERFVTDQFQQPENLTRWDRLLQAVSLGDARVIAFRLAESGVPDSILRSPGRGAGPLELFGADIQAWMEEARELLSLQKQGLKGNAAMPGTVIAAFFGAFHILLKEGYERFREHVSGNDEVQKRLGQSSTYAPSNAKGFEDVPVERLRAVIADGLDLIRILWTSEDESITELLETVTPFAGLVRERVLQQGLVDFDGLLVLARNLLRDHPEVRQAVRSRIRMLLVDEFQDTDPLQYEIVLYLAERDGESAADPFQANLEPGRLFVVGDPKQSIYRFRGADYAAFKTAVTRIRDQGGTLLTLSANFRTVPDVLEPVNRLFLDERSAWSPSEEHQPPYIPLDAVVRQDGDPSGVELWNTPDNAELRARDRRRLEAAEIASEIFETVKIRKQARYRDVLILLRAFSNLELYLRALRDLDIPYIVDGGKGFMVRPEVSQLVGTIRAVAQPSHQAALLAFLRSPAGGVSDRELASFAASGGRWDWRSLDQVDGGEHPGVREAFALLDEMSREVRRQPPDQAVRTIARRTFMSTTGALAFEGSQRVANIDKLCALASEQSRDGRLSLVQLADLLEDERFTESESESPIADESTDSVRVLSIHKAKGLESPIVIVPDLARTSTGHPLPKLEITRLPNGHHAAAVRVGDLRNLASHFHQREERAHDQAESIRLLYVAFTRAKERLIVVSGQARGKTPWVDAVRPWVSRPEGVAQVLMTGRKSPMARDTEAAIRDVTKLVDAYDAAVRTTEERAIPPFRAPSTHDEERFAGSEEPDSLPRYSEVDRDEAKRLGTAVHVALENWNPAQGGPSSNHEDAQELLDAFACGPLGETFREIDIVGREVPMLLQDDGFAWRGSIDLLYRDGDELVVADFKTDVELTDERKKNYGEQLQRYAEAVAKVTDQPVRSELWMVRSGEIIPVPG